MARKTLKKKTQRKSAGKAAAAPVMESARDIWLAGLGAFNVAQQEGARILEEGSKIFDKLVAEGSRIEARTRKDVEGAVEEFRGEVENRMEGVRKQTDAVRKQAAENWDRFEKIFEDRVARSLARLGIPTREDVHDLATRVRALSLQVAELESSAGGVKKQATRPARKVGKKKATRKKKTARKKTARRTTRKAAASGGGATGGGPQ